MNDCNLDEQFEMILNKKNFNSENDVINRKLDRFNSVNNPQPIDINSLIHSLHITNIDYSLMNSIQNNIKINGINFPKDELDYVFLKILSQRKGEF